jgi:hypothetical protein
MSHLKIRTTCLQTLEIASARLQNHPTVSSSWYDWQMALRVSHGLRTSIATELIALSLRKAIGLNDVFSSYAAEMT